MRNRNKGGTEKGMMTAAIVLIGCFLGASYEMGKWEKESQVFRPVQLETEETGQEQEEETEKRDSYIGEEGDLGEALPVEWEPAETFLPEELAADAEVDAKEMGTEPVQADEGRTGEKVTADVENGKFSDVIKCSKSFVEKTEREVRGWVEIPSELWEVDDTKSLVGLSYVGGLREWYGVGASDLKPAESVIYAYYSDGSSQMVSPLLFQAEGFSAEKQGSFQGKISFQGLSVSVPYEVVDVQVIIHPNGGACIGDKDNTYHLYDYTLESLETPQRMGYAFDGWYLEEELKTEAEFPFHASERVTHLYAGWKKYEISYTSEDGILYLPDSRTAIGEREFGSVDGKVEEIYVGAGVTEVAPGAFFGLNDLSYIDVDWKNPNYTTINCSLYTKDGKRLVAYPNALTGTCRLYAGTEILGKYAFYESGISTIVLPDGVKAVEGFVFGKRLKKLKFQGLTPPEFFSREAFAGIADDLVIEVPEPALEDYREVLAGIRPELAEKVAGFREE